ncbi:MAG TPA: hypothetical protein VGO26_11165 [Amnibacterium sp.]|jgi:hypothetical protein|nr:hypothetical protein [Amnibacterium sp.]
MRAARPIIAGALALGVALAVAGCTSSPVGKTVTEAPTRAGTAAAPTPHPVTTPPPTPQASGATPVEAPCAALVPAAVARSLAPGYAPMTSWAPTSTSPVAHLAALAGTVCAWRDATTGHVLEVAVARPSDADALALKNDLVERSNSVPTYREEAYFQVSGGAGEVNDFHGTYWVVAWSPDLYEPGDAAGVIASVHSALDRLG